MRSLIRSLRIMQCALSSSGRITMYRATTPKDSTPSSLLLFICYRVSRTWGIDSRSVCLPLIGYELMNPLSPFLTRSWPFLTGVQLYRDSWAITRCLIVKRSIHHHRIRYSQELQGDMLGIWTCSFAHSLAISSFTKPDRLRAAFTALIEPSSLSSFSSPLSLSLSLPLSLYTQMETVLNYFPWQRFPL